MAYSEFTLETVLQRFSLSLDRADLFPGVSPISLPTWLTDLIERGMPSALGSEKARSEFIVAPLLLAIRERVEERLAIYSGQRLLADSSTGLDGECDFILATAPSLPVIQTPILCVVEAKKNDVEGAIGQCAAQMLGAQMINERDGLDRPTYGAVTTAEVWLFLRLTGTQLTIDERRYYLDNLPIVFGILNAIVTQP